MTFPKSVTNPRFLAIIPSALSLIQAMKYTRSAPTQWYLNSTSEKNINKGIQQNLKTVILFGKFILFLQSNHSLRKL